MLLAGNCQTSQALGLYYDIFDDGEKDKAFNQLLEIIHREKDFMKVGFLGARVLFHVLSDFGYTDLALHMINRPEFPSYGNWVKQGATTLFEAFKENENEGGGCSKNHHFWGDINHWFLRQLCGLNVNPYGNNPSFIMFKPHFAKDIDYVKGSYDTPNGKIFVEWSRENNDIYLTINADENVEFDVRLDKGYVFEESLTAYRFPRLEFSRVKIILE